MMRSARAVDVALRHHEAAEFVGLGHRRRQADAGELRREAIEPRETERKQIAALRCHQRMQLVEDDAAERAEQERAVGGREQQRKLLRRREQDVRRIAALALALRGRRVAGAGLDADRQRHLGDRRFEIARDVDRERLERGDVERVQAAALRRTLAAGAIGEAGRRASRHLGSQSALPRSRKRAERRLNSTRLGRNPASVLPPPVGAISSAERPACAFARSSS